MKFAKQDLEARINSLRRECELFIDTYCEEAKKGTGLPVQQIQMLVNTGSPFSTALKIIQTKRRDQEITDAQQHPATA